MNKVVLFGYVGNKNELKDAGSTKVLNITLGTQRNKKEGENWTKVTDWHTLQFWGKQAENADKYLDKGSKILVEGRIETQSWVKDDQKKSKTSIVVEKFEFGEKKGEETKSDDPFAGAYKKEQVSIDQVPF